MAESASPQPQLSLPKWVVVALVLLPVGGWIGPWIDLASRLTSTIGAANASLLPCVALVCSIFLSRQFRILVHQLWRVVMVIWLAGLACTAPLLALQTHARTRLQEEQYSIRRAQLELVRADAEMAKGLDRLAEPLDRITAALEAMVPQASADAIHRPAPSQQVPSRSIPTFDPLAPRPAWQFALYAILLLFISWGIVAVAVVYCAGTYSRVAASARGA